MRGMPIPLVIFGAIVVFRIERHVPRRRSASDPLIAHDETLGNGHGADFPAFGARYPRWAEKERGESRFPSFLSGRASRNSPCPTPFERTCARLPPARCAA